MEDVIREYQILRRWLDADGGLPGAHLEMRVAPGERPQWRVTLVTLGDEPPARWWRIARSEGPVDTGRWYGQGQREHTINVWLLGGVIVRTTWIEVADPVTAAELRSVPL